MNEITKKTRIPLYLAGAVGLFLIAASTRVVILFASIDSRLANIESHVRLDWTYQDQETWALRLQNENPALKVPDPSLSHHPPLSPKADVSRIP